MNTAEIIVSEAYSEREYCRPHDSRMKDLGAIQVYSSNWDRGADGSGGWSFSPTDEWKFPDGSIIRVAYSYCEETKDVTEVTR